MKQNPYKTGMLLLQLFIAVAILVVMTLVANAQPANHDAVNAARWQSAVVPKHRIHEVQVIAARIQRNQARYDAVSRQTGVPWHVIAALHNMESSGSFSRHLHEGSPLTARTRDVPKGRPKTGNPPFTWEFSACDAMVYDRMGTKNWRSIGPALTAAELYNGDGYRKYHPATPSPYLWAATSVEKPGRYISDGRWSPTARSSQVGVAAIWKALGKP